MKPRERYDKMLLIQEHLAKLQTEYWLLKRLARKVLRCFPADPIGTIDIFVDHSWSPSDIYHWLSHSLTFQRNDPSWADSFHHVFLVEEVLRGAGLSEEVAHSLVMTQSWMFTIPPVTLEFSIKTFINLGYPEDAIKSIANQMPHLFRMPPEHIAFECEHATTSQKGLLWNSYLRRDLIDVQPVPPPTDPRTGRVRGYVQSKPAPKKVNNKPAPATTVERPRTITLPKMEIVEQPIEPEAKRPKKLPPLKLFNPLNDIDPPKPSPDQSQQSVSESFLEEAEEAPVSIFPASVLPTVPALDEVYASNPRDESPSRIQLDRFQAIIEASSSESDQYFAWEKFLANNSWLKYQRSTEYQACMVLLRWVPLNMMAAAHHLLDESEIGIRFRFWKDILCEKEARKVLMIVPEILEIRLYALRRIGRDFIKEPNWVLKPWELLDETELRYRMNEIDAHGKKPHSKPYINMFLEPERKGFQSRLYKLLERLSPQDDLLDSEPDDDPDLIEQNDGSIFMDDTHEPIKPITRDELRERLLARGKKK